MAVILPANNSAEYDKGKKIYKTRRSMGHNEKAMFALDIKNVDWTPLYKME